MSLVSEKRYTCPVCGYAGLEDDPSTGEICPCCATEFGYSNFSRSFEDLRYRWIYNGAKWWSKYIKPPLGWSAAKQLEVAGLVVNPRVDFEKLGRITYKWLQIGSVKLARTTATVRKPGITVGSMHLIGTTK